MRQALDELLRFLLDGDGGGRRKQPRITHEIPMSYGVQGQNAAVLHEISLAGLGMRAPEALAPGSQVKLQIPMGTVACASGCVAWSPTVARQTTSPAST